MKVDEWSDCGSNLVRRSESTFDIHRACAQAMSRIHYKIDVMAFHSIAACCPNSPESRWGWAFNYIR